MPNSTLQFLGGAFVGAVTSVAANAIWSRITAPKLVVHAPNRSSIQGLAYFWGAQVEMAPPPIVSRYPALAVQAALQVRDPKSGAELATYICRWQGTPQPVVPTGPDKYVPNIAGIPFGQRGEVYQHKPEAIDLFVKFDGDQEFYGFPNEAYFHNWRHPHFKFDGSLYYATLAVRHDLDEHILDLELNNPDANATNFTINVRDQRYRSVFGSAFPPRAA